MLYSSRTVDTPEWERVLRHQHGPRPDLCATEQAGQHHHHHPPRGGGGEGGQAEGRQQGQEEATRPGTLAAFLIVNNTVLYKMLLV